MGEIHKIFINKAACAVDLGDGSERGEYVCQDYILRKLGRPMRSISLMYCYYPLDKEFPQRISVAQKGREITHAWDYPYEDYFPYLGGKDANRDGEPFNFMRDIRRHGQDVTLTLTIDPHLPDEYLASIGDDLRSFGRVFLRINHEATGNWFCFNRRASYCEVGDFFCRASRIIKEHAPNVQTIICIGGIENKNAEKITMEEEFSGAVREADIWSVDKYFALHWGWGFDVAETGGHSHARYSVRETYELTKASFERFSHICGGEKKPMVMSELNSDGDVAGAYEQAEMVKLYCDILEEDSADWFSAFTLYQFRDRGRLGLEMEDTNNPDVGIEQPLMKTFKEIIGRERFKPVITTGDAAELPVRLRWGNSEDAEGIEIPVTLEGDPVFCELYFEDDSNLMIEFGGMWFYKSPEARFIDLMPAFFETHIDAPCELTLKIFAPPASGENDLSEPDGLFNYYYTLKNLPEIRVRYAPVEPSRD